MEFHLVLTLVNATAIFWQLTVKSCHSKCEINDSELANAQVFLWINKHDQSDHAV